MSQIKLLLHDRLLGVNEKADPYSGNGSSGWIQIGRSRFEKFWILEHVSREGKNVGLVGGSN